MPTVKNPRPPETIYLQCYDEYTGNLLDVVRDDVTWCRDRINENDAVYILATPELVGLLERLGAWDALAPRTASERDEARALAAEIAHRGNTRHQRRLDVVDGPRNPLGLGFF